MAVEIHVRDAQLEQPVIQNYKFEIVSRRRSYKR